VNRGEHVVVEIRNALAAVVARGQLLDFSCEGVVAKAHNKQLG
jgi:hypothetical protein